MASSNQYAAQAEIAGLKIEIAQQEKAAAGAAALLQQALSMLED